MISTTAFRDEGIRLDLYSGGIDLIGWFTRKLAGVNKCF